MATAAKVEWVYRAGQAHPCDVCGWAGQQVLAVVVEGWTMAQTCSDPDACEEGVAMSERLEEMREEYEAQQRAEAGLGWM